MRLILWFCSLVICGCYNAPKLGQRILVNYEGSNKETDKSVFYYTEKEESKNAGYDERSNKGEDVELQLFKILENYERIRLLKKLEDPKIGVNDKLLLIENNKSFFPELDEIYINILNGGLLSDWDSDF